ncbi:MAG: SDR family NAD(P)-dependent oxidoreductase [Candidatus Jettenia sp. CY-1]|nr:MAG: SDR family NAD(P)-dependent oxidoreductase [Candidatus Jettenia sp. CY-1]
MSTLSDQIAVVTGASSGIGRAVALSLAAQGATVCLVGRNISSLEAIKKDTRGTPSCTRGYQTDLTVDDDVQKLKTSLQQDFGHIDMLIHSAGIFSMGMLESAPVKDLDKQYQINVRAPYLLTQVLLPMIISRHGQIVFVNSSSGLNIKPNLSQYAATKHALKAIADTLRTEVNAYGIRVLSIYPGRTATPMQEIVHKMEGKAYYPERFMQTKDIASVIIHALTLPRSAEVTDINIRPFIKFD